MRDIWFLITDHKGIVKILAILIAIFCVVSIGVSSYTSTMKVQEQQEQQAKKKEKEKQIKNSSVKLKKDQQKTIDEYDDATAQFSALLSSNVWATYSGTGRTLYFTDSSIIIADPEADPSKVEKPFVIKGLSTEKVDVGEMKNLTRYNCAYESDDDKTRVLTVDKNDDGDSRSIIEDFLREQCALYYPTAVEAECNGILTADFNANEYRVDFSLKDTEDQQLTGITVVYHLSTKQCELM